MNHINLDIPGGTYVVAVSGGVDSMLLLHLLKDKSDLNLVVAHFDHGIRHDSDDDRRLVQEVARSYNLPFVYDRGFLGEGASENEARIARYAFLNRIKEVTNAQAIIMAHHRDDVIETAIHNLLRGTNRKGLSSLKSTDSLLRPLKNIDKQTIYKHAKDKGIRWSEDYTNNDISYRRNYIRLKLIPKFNEQQRQEFVHILYKLNQLNNLIDEELENFLNNYSEGTNLNRQVFINLPHKVSVEIMAAWLRRNGIRDFDSKLLENLTVAAKTYKNKQRIDVNTAYFLEISKDSLALIQREC